MDVSPQHVKEVMDTFFSCPCSDLMSCREFGDAVIIGASKAAQLEQVRWFTLNLQ
jgi:hypothetical protein